MNTMQRGMITLLRSAVTGEKLPLPADFRMEDVLAEVKRHSIATLVYEGAVNCGIDKKTPEMQKLFQTYVKMLVTSEGQLREIQRIFDAFDEAGIDYMPLKGCKLKALYPKPELRAMGDADILIRMEQYEQVRKIMLGLGFAEGKETDHELTWHSKQLFLELHKRIMPSYNKDFYGYFGDGWELAKTKNGTRYAMIPEDEMVYLFTHFAKHYRDAGIGCRVVTDLWVFLRNHPDLDQQKVRAELEKLHLEEFYGNMLRLMAVWFEERPSDEMVDYMTGYIFVSGNRGDVDTFVLSYSVRETKHTHLSSRAHYFWSRLFPGVKELKAHYPVLERHLWLLPIIWMVRLIRKLCNRKSTAKTLSNLKALDQSKVDERQKMLNYVGLDYNF